MALNINNAAVTSYNSIPSHSISAENIESVNELGETEYTNERAAQDWAYFNRVAKLKSAILMKAIWTVGKGYTCDAETQVILDHITGTGKQTFLDILFNAVVTKQAVRESYAEIIRDEETGLLLNLKVLDPSSMKIVYNKSGQIKRFEQWVGKERIAKFAPEDIFFLQHNCFAGSRHGVSVPEALEKTILADDESFNIVQKMARHQAVPFIIFKLKTDDNTKIATFGNKIKQARQYSEDMIIPDDENLLSWEVVNINPSAIVLQWRDSINSQFYQEVGMPLILFGGAGTTESGGKIEYLGHETVFEHDQLEIQNQVKAQLGLEIKLNSPTSLLENLKQDENKDAQNAIRMQPNDIQAGVGA